jgi:signal transduction histidine kinase
MLTAVRAAVVMARVEVRDRVTPARLMAVGAVIAVLAAAGSEARHTVLAAIAGLCFLAAGAAFLLRFRVTGTRTAFDVGCGLALLGLHRPVAVAVDALLGGRLPQLTYATGLLLILASATACLRAVPSPRPRRRAGVVITLVGAALAMALAPLVAPAVPVVAVVADGASAVLTGALWTTVAVAAWRTDALDAGDRSSSRALAAIALSVSALGILRAVPAALPGTAVAVQTIGDLALLCVALTAVATSLRRFADALAGQERYVAGLLEQLAGHEWHLQATRACLHDARAAVAGVRAGSSAIRHLPADGVARLDLENAVAAELARLARMLRLPARPTTVVPVDLDQVLRPLVVSHRERGLRVAWAPVEHAPIAVDGDALAVIVGNLLGNALVHAPKALCRVDVEIGERLIVAVSDDGPGLPALHRATAFEAGVHRSSSPGEGLGLAISRDLARRHGGDLVAEEAPVGARFVLSLPLAPAPAPVAVPAPRDGRSPEAAPVLRSAA